ncbi:hypothetical protein KFK09_003891 [Dendrobium nobile]|uniref:RNase H type-1 domain-containing protein n=1 Tax=Dendrobium nobile TaxID=94219 RepID=A0A8T3C4R3_DENNO|nr:hypothetical protein KFK09_003891 [Dendrobium nobile]
MMDAKGLIIEGDNLNIMKHLQCSIIHGTRMEEHGENEDLCFLKGFETILFHFAKRDCNKLAHFCANYALKVDFFFWMN